MFELYKSCVKAFLLVFVPAGASPVPFGHIVITIFNHFEAVQMPCFVILKKWTAYSLYSTAVAGHYAMTKIRQMVISTSSAISANVGGQHRKKYLRTFRNLRECRE